MASHRVEVWPRPGLPDPHVRELLEEAREMGLDDLESVETGDIYLLRGRVSQAGRRRIARLLLADPVTQVFFEGRRRRKPGTVAVEVLFRAGVTDNTGETAREAAGDLPGISRLESVSTGRRYFFRGPGVTREAVKEICGRLLANPLIQTWRVN